jgi:GT2 family glycosyltransferase
LIDLIDVADRTKVAKIVMLYKEILDRPVDPDGLVSYVAELKRGISLATLARICLSSEEYAARDRSRSLSANEVRRLASRIADKIEATGESEWPSLLTSLVEEGKAFVDQPAAYRWWLDDFERPVLQNRRALEARIRSLDAQPTFTFVMSQTGSKLRDLLRTIAAVRAQTYKNIELLVVTRQPWTRFLAKCLLIQDGRIRVLCCREPHTASRLLLQSPQRSYGDFTALIKPGDSVSAIATLEFAEALGRNAALAVIYADSDSFDEHGRRHSPEFRSKWDPDRLLAGEDLGPLVMYSTTSIKRLSELEPQILPDTEFELCARIVLSTKPEGIGHVPRVLYHRKNLPENGRTEERIETLRPLAAERGAGLVPAGGSRNPIRFRLAYPVPRPAPLVSILIPTRDRINLLRQCIETIFERTNYPSFELILIDNSSHEEATFAYYSEIKKDRRIRFVDYPGEFNWGAMNNSAAQVAYGQILVLLNNDTEVIEANWLNELVSQVVRPEIGIVGARLLYPDHTLQHGGVVTTPRGAAQHVMRYAPPEYPGYMGLLRTVREVSAVTGACLAIRKKVYEEVGGVEQHSLRVACSDVDLCLRVRSKGYRVLWTPHATLYHKELATRGSDDTPEKLSRTHKEEAYMATTWAEYLTKDPFWSCNLAAGEDMPPLLAIPPR